MTTVLLIDDEPLTTQAIRQVLQVHFPSIDIIGEVTNGAKAWDSILRKTPDFIISDIRMPHMDGLQLMERVREAGLSVKVILITAYGEFEYARRAIALGAFGYMVKPFVQSELILEVSRLNKEIETELAHKQDISKIIPLVEENMIKKLLVGKLQQGDLNLLKNLAGSYWDQYVLTIYRFNRTSENNEILEEIVKISMSEEINSLLANHGCRVVSFFKKENELVVLYTPKLDDIPILQACLETLSKYTEVTILTGSCRMNFTLEQIPFAYVEADKNLVESYTSLAVSLPDLDLTSNEKENYHSELMTRAAEYCKNAFTKDISLQKISDHLNLNKYYFCTLFKSHFDLTFWEYITDLRIGYSKELLSLTNEKITEISEKCGYLNISHFGKIFKKTTGLTPAEYRKTYQTK
ncbi:response regulator [Paenibacillus sp. LMG 31460]|uniref:Response regulator n=1 Tax=Paenibacillus germinis TaxID=2654979 RepID=A0ABX1Z4U7_9BACL|nr:response regulator [Paenibacillus germinis]NOU88286.1 response regulator [Paenibacillus germinis]